MKKIMAVLLAGMTLSVAAPVFAADPVHWEGDVSVKYEKDTQDIEVGDSNSGVVSTFRLKAEADLGSGWSLYSRLGAQYTSQAGIYDINPDQYGDSKKGVLAIDQFGFNYKTDNLTYKLGRQDVTIGTTALLYSRPDSNIGKKAFVDGLTINGTVGKVDIAAVAAKEDNPSGMDKNKLYAVRAGYAPSDIFNWGVTLGRYADETNGNTNHWAVDGTYTYGKSSLTAEFTKSNEDEQNKAHAITLNYNFDDKTSAYVTAFRVGENGSMGGQTDFDANEHGMHYGMAYNMTSRDALEVVYKNKKTNDTGAKDNSLEVTYSYSF